VGDGVGGEGVGRGRRWGDKEGSGGESEAGGQKKRKTKGEKRTIFSGCNRVEE